MRDLISREQAIDRAVEFELFGEKVKFVAVSEIVKLPSAELGTNLAEVGTDCISRQAATDALRKMQTYKLFSGDDMLLIDQAGAMTELMLLPSAQPEIIRCKDCKYGAVDDPEIPFLRFCEYNGQDWNDENHYCGHAARREEK